MDGRKYVSPMARLVYFEAIELLTRSLSGPSGPFEDDPYENAPEGWKDLV